MLPTKKPDELLTPIWIPSSKSHDAGLVSSVEHIVHRYSERSSGALQERCNTKEESLLHNPLDPLCHFHKAPDLASAASDIESFKESERTPSVGRTSYSRLELIYVPPVVMYVPCIKKSHHQFYWIVLVSVASRPFNIPYKYSS